MTTLSAPAGSRMINEAMTWVEFPRLLLAAPSLMKQPRGAGGRVLVFPGFGAGDGSTAVLRQYLSWLNHNVSGWNRGVNTADVEALVYDLAEQIVAESRNLGREIALVGWSLGGYLAREVAREAPGHVSQVITLGSPVVGGPKYTQVADVYRRNGIDVDMIEAAVTMREKVPLKVPVTAVYSKFDGIVSWEACIDHVSGMTEHVEIFSTHCGLGFSAEAFRVIAQKLKDHR